MKNKMFFGKPFRWALMFFAVMLALTTYILLDTFVIPHAKAQMTVVASDTTIVDTTQISTSAAKDSATVLDNYYADNNIKITIETEYVYDTMVYIADIEISDASYLKTAFAQNTYGRNIKEATSAIAQQNDAVFAINGDYYGFRNDGYVIRNGILFRDTSGGGEDLVIDMNGDFFIVNEDDISAQSLSDSCVQQVLSFGPALIENSEIVVDENSEVGQAKTSNPRTAIGQVSALHYIVIVSDGRTSESAGLTLAELAELFAQRGCIVAYNLDGGGSSTMWFNGEVINIPTDGRTYTERSVSDIVYFG